MGNKYTKIEYPLNNIENLINIGSKNCTNFRDINHSNIDIIYEQKGNDIPSVYRCPVCLSIPIFYYTQEKILYQCNCGIYNCSINYFLTSFISYPISKIIFKDNIGQNNNNIRFCSICSLFVDSSNHSKEYFGHTIKNIDNIFLNKFEYNKKKEIDNQQFREFIKNNLKFDIIKKIEEKYKDFQKLFNKNKTTESNNLEILNQKLYLLSKFLYYSFQTCLSNNVLNYRILTNLCCNYYQIFRLKDFEKSKNKFNINENHFLDDYEKIIEQNRKSKISSNLIKYNNLINKSFGNIHKFFYDKYSQRYLIYSQYYWEILITEKNNYSEIFIDLQNFKNFSIIYFECLKKNVIFIRDSNIIFIIDFENAKIIKKISLPLDIGSKEDINFIEIINNNYLVIGCSNTKLIIYVIIQDSSNSNSLNFEFINKISGNYQDIFKIKDTLIFRSNEYLIFNKFNEIKNNIEEQFKIEFRSNYHIEIDDIGNDQILVKQFNAATCLIYIFEIYNLKTKQKICRYECKKNIDNDYLFLEDDCLLRVYRNGLKLFNIDNLKDFGVSLDLHRVGDNRRKWAVFKDDSGLNIIYDNQLYRANERKIKYIGEMKYKNKYASEIDIKK